MSQPHTNIKNSMIPKKNISKNIYRETIKGKHPSPMKKQPAFTLIELMISMAIIAILATAGVLAYSDYVKKSRDSARGEIARNLNSSVMAYAASNGGKPPSDASEFEAFLSSASETFGGGSLSVEDGVLLKDPVGGRDVCLDAEGNATEPCAFHYTAYDDGTYAISYGVEHESSTEKNFYKTTDSVADIAQIIQQNPGVQPTMPKYGVYTGTAAYIGQPATIGNGQTGEGQDDGIDETYIPSGASSVPQPTIRSIRVDAPSGGGGGGNADVPEGGTCAQTSECLSGLACTSNICAPIDPCDPEYFSGNITMTDYDTQITDYGGGELGYRFTNIVGVDAEGRPASIISDSFSLIGPPGVECGVYGGEVACSLYGGATYVDLYITMGLDACWEHMDSGVGASFEI